jgi:glycosyltransferase involved in cell wall biosynthesis
MSKKILIVSHAHPELSKGGAEVASWNLFQALKQEGYECLYVARTDSRSHGGSTFSIRANDQIMLHTGMTDWFCLSSSQTKHLFDDFGTLMADFQPDIVHVHHYAHIGIEVFAAIKRAVPMAKLIFTLHEYMAICMHNGQMVKNNSLKLCFKESPADCNNCFPERSPADFFLRKQYILDQFAHVDEFISPSQFLANRYIDWGIPKEKMHVIENILPALEKLSPRQLAQDEKRGRLAFFGQLNPYKGIDVLLQAISLLPEEIREFIHLDIHGANLELQNQDFQKKIELLLEDMNDIVTMRGAYESDQLPNLMQETDWVVIPSIWWENSPVVIQEAIALGRPLIGSNIGGMKEKIEDIAGLTFQARSPASLCNAIKEAIEINIFNDCYKKLTLSKNMIVEHIEIYSF